MAGIEYGLGRFGDLRDRKSTRLNSSHSQISYAVFCLKKKNKTACYDVEKNRRWVTAKFTTRNHYALAREFAGIPPYVNCTPTMVCECERARLKRAAFN